MDSIESSEKTSEMCCHVLGFHVFHCSHLYVFRENRHSYLQLVRYTVWLLGKIPLNISDGIGINFTAIYPFTPSPP